MTLARQESRGAHYRTDFPDHNDAKFLKAFHRQRRVDPVRASGCIAPETVAGGFFPSPTYRAFDPLGKLRDADGGAASIAKWL
jgi:hypothetical protein